MSKPKVKKVPKPEEKVKVKEPVERKEGDAPASAEVKPPPPQAAWSDWVWDEALKLYYRAKLERADEWIYDYFDPPVHPATRRVTSSFVSEKVHFPKVEEKVLYAAPEYKFEVPNTKGSEYLVSVREEVRAGTGVSPGAEAGKSAGGNGEHAEEKAAVKVEAPGKDGGRKEGETKNGPNLEKSVDGQSGNNPVKVQPQKDGKPTKKGREKRHERKESRYKESRYKEKRK